MAKLIVAPKNVTPLVQNIGITDDSRSLHCSLHFHYLFIYDLLQRVPNFSGVSRDCYELSRTHICGAVQFSR